MARRSAKTKLEIVGASPDLTTAPPARATPSQVGSDPQIAYVAGDTVYPYFAVDRALPQTIDEAERQFGLHIYSRMLAEPVLAGIVKALKIRVLADGVAVAPSHQAPPRKGASRGQRADYATARMVADYMEAVLGRLADADRPLNRTLWNLLDASFLGHKLAEITFGVLPSGPFAGKMGLASLRCKPRENYAIVLDAMNTFRGIVAKVPGGSILMWQGIVYDLASLTNAIAPEKLLVLTLDDDDSNLQGRSWFRACYDPWYRKQLMKPEEVKTGVQFGGGMITAIAPEEKAGVTVADPLTGRPVNIKQAMASAASQLRNGGFAVFPHGSEVTVHQPEANPQFFDVAMSRYDREMVLAFLLSSRTVLEARHSSKSDSMAAQDLLDELVIYVRQQLSDLLSAKLFRPLVEMSFGPEIAARYSPTAVLQRASRPDFAANATAVAALATAGYLDESQYAEVDQEILGLPQRDGSP